MSDARYAMVETTAYHLWVAEGCPHGRSDQHWLEAERQVAALRDVPAASPTAAAQPKRRTAAKPAAKASVARPAAATAPKKRARPAAVAASLPH